MQSIPGFSPVSTPGYAIKDCKRTPKPPVVTSRPTPERRSSYNRPIEVVSGSATEGVSVVQLPDEVHYAAEDNVSFYSAGKSVQ